MPLSGGTRLWHRERLDAMRKGDVVRGMWEIGDRFVILGGPYSRSDGGPWTYLLISRDGVTWESVPVSRDLGEVGATAVGDGRLWLLSRPAGSRDSAGWELVSTHDGTDWASSGQVDLRIGETPDISGLVRTGDGWVAAVRDTIWESSDGLRWTKASEQPTVEPVAWVHLARLGSATIVFAAPYIYDESGARAGTMVRQDGDDSWTTSSFTMPPSSAIERVACRSDGCVAAGSRFDQPVAWGSTDGLTWSSTDLNIPVGIYRSRVGPPVATAAGFLILTVSTGHAWLSTNGTDWRLIRTQPVDLDDTAAFHDYVGFAVGSDDLVVALGEKEDGPEAGHRPCLGWPLLRDAPVGARRPLSV